MKAYEVSYSTPRSGSTRVIVLALDETSIEDCLSNKLEEFKRFRYVGGSRLLSYREIPLSNVMVSDLSITELLELTQKN